MNKRYSTLIVDWGGVCVSDGTSQFLMGVCEKFAVSKSVVSDLLNGSLGSQYRCGLISYDAFWDSFTSKIGVSREEKYNLSKWWNSLYTPQTEVLNLLRALKQEYRLIYLSDNLKERADFLNRTYHVAKIFDAGVFSFEVGCRKPSLSIYENALTLANDIPRRCIYIDDQPKFLLPAEKLGMKTILYTTSSKLREDLGEVLEWEFGQ